MTAKTMQGGVKGTGPIIHERLTELSKKKGKKLGRVCLELGISRGLASDLKMGRKEGLSAVTANKFAEYFNVSVGYILGNTPETEDSVRSLDLTDQEVSLIQHFRKLSDEHKMASLCVVKALGNCTQAQKEVKM